MARVLSSWVIKFGQVGLIFFSDEYFSSSVFGGKEFDSCVANLGLLIDFVGRVLNVFGFGVIIFLFYFFELLKFCFFLFFFVLSFLRKDGGLRRNSRFPDGSFEF